MVADKRSGIKNSPESPKRDPSKRDVETSETDPSLAFEYTDPRDIMQTIKNKLPRRFISKYEGAEFDCEG